MDATTTFEAWAIPNPVRDALSKQGIVTPTKIQAETIAAALEGQDLLGHASNGTGKTLGYCLSLVSLLDRAENRDKMGLVLAPCEESATQVHDIIKKLTSKMTGRWKPVLAIDSTDIGFQEESLRKRPRMIVATPERILSHINSGIAKLDNVKFVVMEEADRILKLGHADSLNSIIDAIPSERQTMIFTSTIENDVEAISTKFSKDPKKLDAGKAFIPETVAPANNQENEEVGRFDALLKGLEEHTGTTIVFCRTKFRARRLAQRLFKANHPTDCIHSDRSQNQKNNTIKAFSEGQFRVLVATDIAIGTIELENITHLVNYDVQEFPPEYMQLVANKDDTLAWVNPESSEQWQELQKILSAAAAERVAEIQKQKAIARENGELPERPRKKKSARPAPKHKKRAPISAPRGEVNGNAAPMNNEVDEDSQIFFQPSVEEQLNQLDSMMRKKVRPQSNGNSAPRRGNNTRKKPNSGNRGNRGNGNGNGYY
ncbi:MAG: hypothetical protein CME71_13205 [Halobacteriovorax sp.]|nr:hypothetical protein [Halobacteriovorax sp.]